jgi:hypothetical protein
MQASGFSIPAQYFAKINRQVVQRIPAGFILNEITVIIDPRIGIRQVNHPVISDIPVFVGR